VSDSPGSLDPDLLRRWASALKGRIFLPGDAAYESARRVWNRGVDRHPAVIVRCAGADDIVRTVELARQSGAPLAIRSGGHSQAGHGTGDGIVADLGDLRAITVDDGRRVMRVACGARVSDAIAAAGACGLVTPMGGCPDVGVGGLTLGGGENFLMAGYGAVCDNVVSAQVVLADGRLVTANDEENPDLFWALRGGSGNFGVTVSFDYRLHPVGEVLSGQLFFPVPRARATLQAYRDLMCDAPDALETSGGLTFLDDTATFFIAMCLCGDRQAAEQLASRWCAALAPERDTLAWATYSADLVVPAAASEGTGVFLPDLREDVIDLLSTAMAAAPPAASAVWNDFHGAVTRVPVDAMAFPLRHRGFDMFISAPWDEAGGTRARAIEWVDTLGRALRPFGRGVYVNNLSDRDANRVSEAYGPNYARLAAIKRKYDPDNLFHTNHNIVPG
jgi:FAD/FMN-containing dehydrogenase